MKIYNIISVFRDFFFPPICPICRQYVEMRGICFKCRSLMEVDFNIIKNDDYFLYFMTRYKNEYVREMWHSVKYRRMKYILDDLGYSMGYALKNNIDTSIYNYIVPVPMHFLRWVNRGFNQSEIIASIISDVCDIPVFNGIKRKRYTRKMSNLSHDVREQNIKNAFGINEKVIGNFLVIDDIFTTGSTFKEIRKVLKHNGAGKVDIFVYSYAG